ncbi:hypothetical protein GPECTOR_12g369 [Gonium pectorale]|uniref:phytol kinase n=1 Tax=Gonium pectorale TaxID=33097 RepID=A0A150GNL5_GONPE|nr:hypothetical protein GPECTOR_12g369 [Gonium pectorale]|eukprot:KXZ51407.1 hypothetical protein GPECTOR_12g369 [Gonium pectorale]
MASSRRAPAAARGGRGRPADDTAAPSDTFRLPVRVRTELQSLSEEVDRLFESGGAQHQHQGSDSPLASASAARLRKLVNTLNAMADIADSEATRFNSLVAILTRTPGRPALLRLLGAAVRLPAADLVAGFAAADGGARYLRAAVAQQTLSLVVTLAGYVVEAPGLSKAPVQAFLRAVLQTQALHAASRQLAALAEERAAPGPGAPQIAGGEAGGEAGGGPGGEARADDTPKRDRKGVLGAAAVLLTFSFGLLFQIARSLPDGAPRSPADRLLFAALVEALESSGVLEHAARLLVLVLERVMRDAAPPLEGTNMGAFKLFFPLHIMLTCMYCSCTDAGAGADAAIAAAGAGLRRVLCGRCVTHAALVLGLANLAPVDGGSSYGLDEIVRSPAVRAVAGEYCGPSSSGGLVQGTEFSRRDAFLTLVRQLHIVSGATADPPAVRLCRRGAFALALRAGRLEVAAAVAAEASGSDPSPPPPPRPPAAGPMSWLSVTVAFEAAARQLYPLEPGGRGWSAATDAEAEAGLWHLGVFTLRRALSVAPEGRLRDHCRSLEAVWRRAAWGGEELEEAVSDILRLPPSPRRPVGAALSAGLLPCLEYLLRSAGRDPGGWQAAAVRGLTWLGEHLVPLLAYGDAREAASLVVTLGKLFRRALADPRVVSGKWQPRNNSWQSAVVIAGQLIPAVRTCLADRRGQTGPGGAVEAGGPGAAAAAGEAAAVPEAPSPASGQLATLMSMAACRWLPPLSALAKRAVQPLLMAQQPSCAGPGGEVGAAGGGGGGGGSRGEGGGGGGGGAAVSPKTAAALASVPLAWNPLLRVGSGSSDAPDKAAAASPVGRDGAPAAARPAAADAESVAGEIADSGDGDWRAVLLDELGVVPLLESALDVAPGLLAADMTERGLMPVVERLLVSTVHMAMQHVAEAAAEADKQGAALPSSGSAGGAAAGMGGVAAAAAAWGAELGSGPMRSGAPPPQAPELLRAMGALFRAQELPTEAEAAEALAAAVTERWGGKEAGDAGGGGGCDGAAKLPSDSDADSDAAAALCRLALAMPPPSATRRLLATCANPGCANLEGDSEAGLRLTPCAGCGEAAYCCRDCWTAHWRAGHRAACARRRLGGGG